MRAPSSALALALLPLVGCGTGGAGDVVVRPPHLATLPAWVDDEPKGHAAASAIAAPKLAMTSLGETGGPPEKTYSTRLIDLDVKDADLHDVCRLLAEVGKVNIVVDDDVKGSVTLKLTRVPWDRALEVILRAKGYVAERDGNIVLVGTRTPGK